MMTLETVTWADIEVGDTVEFYDSPTYVVSSITKSKSLVQVVFVDVNDGGSYFYDAKGEVVRALRAPTPAEVQVLREEVASLKKRLEATLEYAEYPGNWSALDYRRFLLKDLLDGKDVEWTR